MPKLIMFNSVSLDGFFCDANGDMRWAHNMTPDKEWTEFVAGNASGGGVLLFGRKTYDLMAGYWPTPQAKKDMPKVAEGMNRMPKIVFSRTMDKPEWTNSTVVKGDIAAEVKKWKAGKGPGMCILGSGSIVSQLTEARLIDEYQIVTIPIIIGSGRTLFEGVKTKISLKLIQSRSFKNGNVFSSYEVV